jgi:hypothetical protein
MPYSIRVMLCSRFREIGSGENQVNKFGLAGESKIG